jgi:L-threonylcarbamoyladenylate synthase
MNVFENEVRLASEALRKGRVILYPTDTVWGLGCDATNSRAVERMFRIKRRKEQNSLIALIESTARLGSYLKEVPPMALDLIAYAANPISIVYPGAKNLAKNVLGKDGSICFRVTNDPFCTALVKHFGKPIASTSANISGEPTPLFFGQISDEVKQRADHIVGLHQDEIKAAKATSIIRLEENGQFTILRR